MAETDIQKMKEKLDWADAIVVGSGAGLSTSAGYVYTGERFHKYFQDFINKYGFEDMYSGGFYPFETLEEHWAYWSRYIYINRFMKVDNGTYKGLVALLGKRDAFCLTTNVDHQWQLAGWDKKRLFYTQGDYGLWQCSDPCDHNTYDNETTVRKIVLAQGFRIDENGDLGLPEDGRLQMTIPSELVPRCPDCGKPMTMNLRADNTFVQDSGWDVAAERYTEFLRRHKNMKTLFLELGVGYNTPGIIKYPFWQMTNQWPDAYYACINYGQAEAPREIRDKSICIDGDIGTTIRQLYKTIAL